MPPKEARIKSSETIKSHFQFIFLVRHFAFAPMGLGAALFLHWFFEGSERIASALQLLNFFLFGPFEFYLEKVTLLWKELGFFVVLSSIFFLIPIRKISFWSFVFFMLFSLRHFSEYPANLIEDEKN